MNRRLTTEFRIERYLRAEVGEDGSAISRVKMAPVIPAKAGIQDSYREATLPLKSALGSRFRGNDAGKGLLGGER